MFNECLLCARKKCNKEQLLMPVTNEDMEVWGSEGLP